MYPNYIDISYSHDITTDYKFESYLDKLSKVERKGDYHQFFIIHYVFQLIVEIMLWL